MRVLHVVPSLSARIGGPAISVVESSLALRDHGVETTIFATDMAGAVSNRKHRRATPEDLPKGADTLDVRLFRARWPHRLAFAPSIYLALAEAVPQHDVVHIHMLFTFPQFAAYRQATGHGVPYVVSPCGALDPHLRGRSRLAKTLTDVTWQRDMLARAAALHYKSHDEARLVADLALPAPPAVVPNGVRWDSFQRLPPPEAFRARWGLGDAPVILNLGRLSHKKGLDVLVRAFAIVLREHASARLVLAGPDDEALTPRLRALAEREGVADRVTFTGMLFGDEKLAALAAADVWALPSHSENFGVAIVEAMAAGRAVVTTPHVNIAEAIRSSDAAVICDLDAGTFAAEIGALLRHPARRAALGERARAFARRYDWSCVAPQLVAMYEGVVERSKEMRRAA